MWQGGPTGVHGVGQHPVDKDTDDDSSSSSAKEPIGAEFRLAVVPTPFHNYDPRTVTFNEAPVGSHNSVLVDPVQFYHLIQGLRLPESSQREFDSTNSPELKTNITTQWKTCLKSVCPTTLGKFRLFCCVALAISTTDTFQAQLMRMTKLEVEPDGRSLAFSPPGECLSHMIAQLLHGDLQLTGQPKHTHPWAYIDKIMSSVASVMARLNGQTIWRHGKMVSDYLKHINSTDGDGKRTLALDPVEDFPKLWKALWEDMFMSVAEKIRSMCTRGPARSAMARRANPTTLATDALYLRLRLRAAPRRSHACCSSRFPFGVTRAQCGPIYWSRLLSRRAPRASPVCTCRSSRT